MKLYLVQHGEAKSKDEDPERSLTEQGKEDVGAVAKKLAEAGIKVDHIYHSPKLRALQTADIFTTYLKSHATEDPDLKPMDDPNLIMDLLDEAAKENKDMMLVGHMPYMSRLAGLLLTGKDDPVIEFTMGAVVCLGKEECWKVNWILTPELA